MDKEARSPGRDSEDHIRSLTYYGPRPTIAENLPESLIMQLVASNKSTQTKYAREIPDLVWATGPVSYDYHFADRALFDGLILASWQLKGSLFAADATTLATDEDRLVGIEIGMPGNEFRARQKSLEPIWGDLLANGQVDAEGMAGVLERSGFASWLNPVIKATSYYIHAISVKPEYRGKRAGYLLMENAITSARDNGFSDIQLDLLSDNSAVGFYRAVGFEVLAETTAPKPAAFGIPPEYRMGMAL